MSAVTFKTISDLLADPVLGKLPEVREYRRVRGNDLDENPAFEQGRSYVRDFADAALLAIGRNAVYALATALIAKDDEVKGLNAYEYVVRRIAEWDQLNPPISGDHAWVKKLVEDVLLDNEGEAKRTGEWFGTVQRELAAEKARADKAEAMLQAIDMMDLAPLATRPDLSLWQRENPWPPADYACEPSHKHPTVSDYLADLARRTGGEA